MKIKNIIVNFLQKLSFAIAVIVFVAGIGYILSILFDKNLDDKHFTVISGIFAAFLGAVFSYMFQVSRDDMEREAHKREKEQEREINKTEKENERKNLEKVELKFCFYKLNTLLLNLAKLLLFVDDIDVDKLSSKPVPFGWANISLNESSLKFLANKFPLLLEGIFQIEADRDNLIKLLEDLNDIN